LNTREDVNGQKLVLFGRSLGCAVAIEMATRHRVHAVVIESAFTSVQAMAKRAYPFLPCIDLILGTKYDRLEKIKNIKAPIMMIHGDKDRTVPPSMARKLFDAAYRPKRSYTVTGAGHNDTYLVGGQDYYDAIIKFLVDLGGDSS
jgi:fermentation-respiration switch protein FrsA (DUF1100 family)